MMGDKDEPWLWVMGLGLWMPGAESAEEFGRGERGPGVAGAVPKGLVIERRSRRRASRLTKAHAEACAQAAQQAGFDTATMATVFGSTLGEVPTMLSLLDELSRGIEMSPMGFATSVHNASSGVVSISGKNRGFTTALSSDFDTAAAALLEAWGLVHTQGGPTVLVCGDDQSPQDFVPEEEAFDLLAVSLALGPVGMPLEPDHPPLARLSLPELSTAEPNFEPVELSARAARNPQAGCLDLLAAVQARAWGTVRLDRGMGSSYQVRIEAP